MDGLYRLFEGTRAIDWLLLIVDFLVLLAILWFELPEWLHKRRAGKKARLLAPFLERGEELRSSAHERSTHDFMKWMDNARDWGIETQVFLEKESPRAASAFKHIVHLRETDRAVVTDFGQLVPLTGLHGDAYQLLQARLDNLQKIIDSPEVYF